MYPEHKFSHLIDSDFSFGGHSTNIEYPSKTDTVNKLKNARCDGTVMLEPRLQEYMKKKRTYKRENIAPCVSLEKEFQITPLDRKVLRNFLKGRTDLYNTEPAKLEDGVCKSTRSSSKKIYFPSKEFRNSDPRVPQLKKNKSDELPLNRGMFYPGEGESFYDDPIQQVNPMMDSRDFIPDMNYVPNLGAGPMGSVTGLNGGRGSEPDYYQGNNMRFDEVGAQMQKPNKNIVGFNLNDQRFDPRTDPRMNPGPEMHSKFDSQYRVGPGQQQQKYGSLDPRNNYIISNLESKGQQIKNNSGIQMTSGGQSFTNFPDYQENDYNLVTAHDRNQYSRQDGFGKFGKQTFSEKSIMDVDNKMVIPKMTQNSKKDLNYSNYRMMPYFPDPKGTDKLNIDTETAMIRGMPSHTTKSYGYRNPAENYFQYGVENDFGPQAIDNLVEPWMRGGMSTRRDNKAVAKQRSYREIM